MVKSRCCGWIHSIFLLRRIICDLVVREVNATEWDIGIQDTVTVICEVLYVRVEVIWEVCALLVGVFPEDKFFFAVFIFL